jgi:hypothetical protein
MIKKEQRTANMVFAKARLTEVIEYCAPRAFLRQAPGVGSNAMIDFNDIKLDKLIRILVGPQLP